MSRGKIEGDAEGGAGQITLLVDGECVLCHWITRFVTKRDSKERFRFAALQSKAGQRLLQAGGLSTEDLDTFVMIDGSRYYTKSDAALRVLRQLDGAWPLLYGAVIVPAPLRNVVYSLIAGTRYKVFGRVEESCPLPTAAMRNRSLEDEEQGAD
ncbi:thiol-disulfide oxidoreductase DCC family protein [Paenibacillus gorillae]|uniref:thiol-disulfide oxidoreductase DCC family protein n=1 Tax=Paenibacillus gorillae TaxID=1243662 RepID=UPI0004B0B74E|nr:DCC1-like thiol-disulfide oxidoreductase family protein [Paenibacillus gorillae]